VGSNGRAPGRWYAEVSRYQWMVLALASLGWIFDVFEGQIFVASMNEAMPALLPAGTSRSEIGYYNDLIFAAFLLGGAAGGVLFGVLGDRIGRKRAMTWTILTYSVCTGLSAFAQSWWQLAVFRFLVALGVGGEWAVASVLVAEVFPLRARAWSQSIFHASSVLGTFLAIAAGAFLVANPRIRLPLPGGGQAAGWRLAFLLGALPALLILWVRTSLHEPELWQRSRESSKGRQRVRLAELFRAEMARRTLVGVGLAGVGLATFWGTYIYGKDALRAAVAAEYLATHGTPADAEYLQRAEMVGMFLATTGIALGQLAFGPLAERLGRRGAFLAFQLGGLAASLVLFHLLSSATAIGLFLPLFGFLTVGMHAGYAVYFPELFPTHLRGTGAGFCFNGGRLLAAPALFAGGWMQKAWGVSLTDAAAALGWLFVVGSALLWFAPETRGRELPP
jgi:MFS family permease